MDRDLVVREQTKLRCVVLKSELCNGHSIISIVSSLMLYSISETERCMNIEI